MNDILTLEDGTQIDIDTGEIIEEGTAHASDPSGRLAWLSAQFHEAKTQAGVWETQRKLLSMQCQKLAASLGVKNYEAPGLKFTAVAGHTGRSAKAENALKAVEAEVITHDDLADLLIFAARDLDPKAVTEWIGGRPEATRKVLAALLINEYPVNGHLRVSPVMKDGTRALRTEAA
jgi:hypothetical protein